MRIDDPNDPFYGLDVTPVDEVGEPMEMPNPSGQRATNGPVVPPVSPIQATEFGNYNGGGADPRAAQLVADYIQQNGLQANQSDPSSLNKIAEYLRSQGINAQTAKTDSNGHTGGLVIDGNELQLIDGSNRWTPLQTWDQGGQNQFGNVPQFQSPVAPLGAPETLTAGQAALPEPPTIQNVTPQPATAVTASYAPQVSPISLSAPEKYRGVSDADLRADPSYEFRLKAGTDQLQNSAAAKGTLFSRNALQGLNDWAQGYASQEYGNIDARNFRNFSSDVDNRYRVDASNADRRLSADTFNAGQQQQVNLSNADRGQQVGLFNVGQQTAADTGNADRALSGYATYAPLRVNTQLANIGNTLDASKSNIANKALYQGQDFSQALGAFGANTNAGLGFGNLALDQNQFGLAAQGQNWNQAFLNNQDLWNRWYKTVQLGQPPGGGS